MNWPKISIITPSFNQGQFIEQTIDSVLSQGYPNLEYIIIDGGSADDSIEVIERYKEHLAYWVSEPDSGQSEAINKGLKRATGEVFNWLNSDDYYAANALFSVGKKFSDPTTNVFAAKSNIIFPDGSTQRSSRTDVYPNNLAKTIGCARIDQPETFFRKSCIDQLGGVNEGLQFLMDRDLWIRYLLRFGLDGIVQSEDILVNFRIHEQSKTGSQALSFNVERDSYFYTLAKKGESHSKADLLQEISNCQLLNIPAIDDNQLLDQVLNYFLMYLAEEQYQKNARKAAGKLFQNINPRMLDTETRELFQKIRFRNQYIPLWLVRLFRSR